MRSAAIGRLLNYGYFTTKHIGMLIVVDNSKLHVSYVSQCLTLLLPVNTYIQSVSR